MDNRSMNMIKTIYDSTLEDFGYPATLHRFIKGPGIIAKFTEKKTVDASSVGQWQNWSLPSSLHEHKSGTMMGWRYTGGSYHSFLSNRSEFENITRCTVINDWKCDIQDITGLGASKSNLNDFTSLDEMVEENSKEMIDRITEQKLKKNLSHSEIRILNREDTDDYFTSFLWDGRVFLINSGGSHHFAAARYIAARIGQQVPLKGKLKIYSINPIAVDSLQYDFDLYAIPNESSYDFCKAMQRFRATYYWYSLPKLFDQYRLILLPKNERRSAKVSSVLRDGGLFNVGNYLQNLINKQPSIH